MEKHEVTVPSAAYLCPVTMAGHHYHTDKGRQFYYGSSYLSVCCQCGRVQLIVYRGRQETPDLTACPGSECGPFVK